MSPPNSTPNGTGEVGWVDESVAAELSARETATATGSGVKAMMLSGGTGRSGSNLTPS